LQHRPEMSETLWYLLLCLTWPGHAPPSPASTPQLLK
jgi:hypothetical protein